MQHLSGNQRSDLLTSLMNMSLVLRLPREMHLCRSSANVPRLPSFLEMLQTPTFCSLSTGYHWKKTQCFATLLPFHAPASSVFWLFLFPVFVLLVFSSLTLPTSAFHLSILSEVWLLNFLRWICYIYIEVENQCCFIFLRCILGEIPASLLTEMLPSGRCLLGRHHSWALCWCWSTACSPRRRLREL